MEAVTETCETGTCETAAADAVRLATALSKLNPTLPNVRQKPSETPAGFIRPIHRTSAMPDGFRLLPREHEAYDTEVIVGGPWWPDAPNKPYRDMDHLVLIEKL